MLLNQPKRIYSLLFLAIAITPMQLAAQPTTNATNPMPVDAQAASTTASQSNQNSKKARPSVMVIEGIRSVEGLMRAAIFTAEDGFPSDDDKTVARYEWPVTATTMKIVVILPDAPAVAVSFHHDKNADGKVNTNFIGIPKEGFAASNNAKGRFGPPDFEDAAMDRQQRIYQRLQMQHIGRN